MPRCLAAVLAYGKPGKASPRDAAGLGSSDCWLDVGGTDRPLDRGILGRAIHPSPHIRLGAHLRQGYVSSLRLGAPGQHALSLPRQTRGAFPLQLGCVFPIKMRAPGAGTGSLPPDLGVPGLGQRLWPWVDAPVPPKKEAKHPQFTFCC